MVAKRVSRRKHPVKPGGLTGVPELTEPAVLGVLESAEARAPTAPGVDAEMRRGMIAAAAYFIAERRGFAAGHELDDWVAAEAAIEAQLQEASAA